MAKTPRKAPGKKKPTKPKHYEKPLSLHPMRFVDAVDAMLATKPAATKAKPRKTKKRR